MPRYRQIGYARPLINDSNLEMSFPICLEQVAQREVKPLSHSGQPTLPRQIKINHAMHEIEHSFHSLMQIRMQLVTAYEDLIQDDSLSNDSLST
jgi:hypothetical protein